jgi:hypothetical protein
MPTKEELLTTKRVLTNLFALLQSGMFNGEFSDVLSESKSLVKGLLNETNEKIKEIQTEKPVKVAPQPESNPAA